MLLVHVVHSEGYKKSKKKKKAQVYTQDHWPTQPKFILISLEHEVTKSITTPPLKGMLVHYKVTPFPKCHQASLTIRRYSSWVERQCERKVFAQEQNMSTQPELVSAIQQFCITFCSMICLWSSLRSLIIDNVIRICNKRILQLIYQENLQTGWSPYKKHNTDNENCIQ